MKGAIICLALGLCIFLVLFGREHIFSGKDTIDIHLHDTFYVIAKWHFYLFLFLFLSTISFIGGVIETRFKNKGFLIGMLILLAIDIYLIISIVRSFNETVPTNL